MRPVTPVAATVTTSTGEVRVVAVSDGQGARPGQPGGPGAPAPDDRHRHLDDLHVALSAAGTVAEVAGAVSTGLRRALRASVVSVCTAGTDRALHTVDVAGYPAERLPAFATLPLSAALPLTDAARTRTPVWLGDRAATVAAYPQVASSLLPGTQALAALPLLVADRLIGALGVTFLEPMPFGEDERSFLVSVAGQVAMAVERAGLADAQREMAETLQRSLLPGALPDLDGLAVAARYLPAVAGTSAGGDWYDVLTLDDGRVAVAVGDVVGHGAAAAAVMGQLRSALTTLLLAGFGPARALELLDRFATRVPGAGLATAACVLLDRDGSRLTHSSAGHPPPLVVRDGASAYLSGATGAALGVALHQTRQEEGTVLPAGSTLLLYTDGLVEARGTSMDAGLSQLAAAAAASATTAVTELVDGLLAGLVERDGADDDVAVVAVRLLPAPLHLDVPATPMELSGIRRAAGSWAATAGLHPDTTEDLQLALGEAAGNAAEHAYRDAPAPGRLTVALAVEADGAVRARVDDGGRWRPAPVDPGHRGRGLAMISALATDVDLDHGPAGTTVRFRLVPAPTPAGRAPGVATGPGPMQPATATVSRREGTVHVAVAGDLDQVGVASVADALLGETGNGTPVVVDLTGLGWLTSVGIGLLLQAAQRAGGQARFVLPAAGPARRVLDLTAVTSLLVPAVG